MVKEMSYKTKNIYLFFSYPRQPYGLTSINCNSQVGSTIRKSGVQFPSGYGYYWVPGVNTKNKWEVK